jgi:proline iminopeptidase
LAFIQTTEGRVKVLGHELFYRAFTPENPAGTILCLHGGPGMPHEYILPLADLANFGFRVVFYDQLGTGRSDVPKNKRLFTVEHYVEETEEFRRVMRLGRIHLWGSSWGGFLGIAYALKYQEHLKTLTSASGSSSTPLTFREMLRLKSELPDNVKETLQKYEDNGDYTNPEYLIAMEFVYRRHTCRLAKWPEEFVYTLRHASLPVYETMWGPNEFTLIGNLMYWDVTEKLGDITVPTLLTCGRYDEVTPTVQESMHRKIKSSTLLIFEQSSHVAFWEERDQYMKAMRDFLDQHN